MKKTIILLALFLTACGGASTPTGEADSALDATAIAEVVFATQTAAAPVEQPPLETASPALTLSTEHSNAAPVSMQLILSLYQLEGTAQAVTAAQAITLVPFLISLKEVSADTTIAQEQVDALIEQAVSVLTVEQIQAITAMQITPETAMSAMQQLGLTLGGPGQGDGKAPDGNIGQPSQGIPPGGGPGDQPPDAGQMGTPPTNGMQRSAGFLPPQLIDALIQFLQEKAGS